MVGGVTTTAVVVLLVIFPAVYCIWRGWSLPHRQRDGHLDVRISTERQSPS